MKRLPLQVKVFPNIEIYPQWLCCFNLNNIWSSNTKQRWLQQPFFFWNLGKKDSSQCYNINTLIQAPIWLNPNKNYICYMIKMLMYIYSLCKTWSSCNRASSYQRYPSMDSLSLMPLHFFRCCPTKSV